MDIAPRALVIGCAVEAACMLPFAFGGFGPCTMSLPGMLGLLLHAPGGLVGFGLQALLGFSEPVAIVLAIVAQAAFWTAIAYAVLRVRRRWAVRRADALPTI